MADSPWASLMGGMGNMGGLMGSDPATLGLSLMAAAGPSKVPMPIGAVLGQGALAAQQQTAAMQDQQMKRMQFLMQMQRMKMLNDAMSQPDDPLAAQGQQQAAAPGTPVAAPQGMPQSGPGMPPQQGPAPMPQGAPQSAAPPGLPQSYAPVSTQQLYSTQVPNTLPLRKQQLLAMASGTDPSGLSEKYQAAQLAYQQQLHSQAIAKLDTVSKSETPAKYAQADPDLMSVWSTVAPQLGYDPAKDFNDDNMRRVLNYTRNQLSGSLKLGEEAPPMKLRTVPTGLGGSYQVDDATGKITPGAPQQETGQFVTPDGIRLMPKATGIAAGYAPYNAATYVNQPAADSTAHMIATYRMPPLTGQALRSQQGYETMRAVQAENPQYDATQYAAKNKAREAFTSGTNGNTVRSLSVANDHLDQLAQAAQALNNGNIPLANTIANTFGTQTGNPAVTNFNSMREIVGDEVAKAVVGGKNGEGDRQAIKQGFSANGSPAQIGGTILKYKGLMKGQLEGLRRQYEQATGLKDFDDMVSPNARSEVGGSVPAARTYDPASGTFK